MEKKKNDIPEPTKRGPGRPKKTTPTSTPSSTPPSSRPGTPGLDSVNPDPRTTPTFNPAVKITVPPISVSLASQIENPNPKTPTPSAPLQPATRDELRTATIDAIAKQQASASQKRVQITATEAAKNRKEFNKEIENSEFMYQQKQELCHMLNAYRQKYASSLNFPFKKEYTVAEDYAVLQSTKAQIELLLNTQHAPNLLKDALLKVSEFLELGSSAIGYPYLNLNGFHEAMVANAQSGFFDEELDQLALKYASYFNLSPEQKLGGKVLVIGLGRVANNVSEYQKRIQGAKLNHKVANNNVYTGL
jgi:hypothetical protein